MNFLKAFTRSSGSVSAEARSNSVFSSRNGTGFCFGFGFGFTFALFALVAAGLGDAFAFVLELSTFLEGVLFAADLVAPARSVPDFLLVVEFAADVLAPAFLLGVDFGLGFFCEAAALLLVCETAGKKARARHSIKIMVFMLPLERPPPAPVIDSILE
jgi:hypothetical protein